MRNVARLRRRLTVMFAAGSALGLLALALFASHIDGRLWRSDLDTALSQQLKSDDWITDQGTLSLDDMADDDADPACPPVFLLNGTFLPDGTVRNLTVTYQADTKRCLDPSLADLDAVAAAAMVAADDRNSGSASREGRDRRGRPIRLLAKPVWGPTHPVGAFVIAGSESPGIAAHRRLDFMLVSGCALTTVLSAFAGHYLARRATRPVVVAIEQQEAFLADAAHDLRNPLAALRMLSETALLDPGHDPELLRRTVLLSRRMGDVVDGLLTRSRLVAGVAEIPRTPLRLDQLVQDVVDAAIMADTADTGDTAESPEPRIQARTAEIVVPGDPGLLRRAVANLIDNALTHGHAPGVPADVLVEVDGVAAGRSARARISVDDAGPGLPAGDAERLFERFRSGADSSGLGLSIALWVARAHGGDLSVGASARGGTRFVLTIPAAG
ncbi:HAMP domain-containing sensor histidine kinase [Catenulispora subtropica]|uniref:sensor histidine kinase n=1 Tax=Catenulispora subtropica TaxID=450798 RepID=UPI0031CF4F85